MLSGDDWRREMRHLVAFVCPAGILRLDGDDTRLHIVDIVLVLFEGHGDHCDIDLLVDAFRLQTILKDVACGMGQVVGYLHRLCNGLDGLGVDYLLRGVKMSHDGTEKPEEDEQQEQAEENDTHSQQGDAKAVGILTFQIGILRLIGLDEVLDAWRDILS